MFKSIKFVAVSFVLASFIIPSPSFAQVADVDDSEGGSSCITINNNLSYKKRNTYAQKVTYKEDVVALQDFLNEEVSPRTGTVYLSDASNFINGYFDKKTEVATARFQKDNGLAASPAGFVGAGTRAKIHQMSCGDSSEGDDQAGGGTFPPGCVSNSGFSSETGESCAGTGPIMCTQEMRLCPDGTGMPRGPGCGWHPEQCGTVVSPQPISSVPTIEFIGQPTLRLNYSYQGKESMLVGKATIKITAGNTPVDVSGIPYMLRFFMNNAITNSSNGTTYNIISSSVGSNTIIQGNNSATFTIEVKAPTRELFPGSYTLGSSLHTVSSPQGQGNPILIMGEVQRTVLEKSSYPPVTIIGETSPYITNILSDASSQFGGYLIIGTRFSRTSNTVSINGVTKVFGSTNNGTPIAGNYNGTTIILNPSDFNLVSGTSYNVQVSTNNGASNNISFVFNGNMTPLNSSVSAVVTNGPSLALTYDSNNKEASLIAKATIEVTAGSSDLNVVKPTAQSWPSSPLYFSLSVLDGNNGGGGMSGSMSVRSSNANDKGDYWLIPAGKSSVFYLSQSFNPKQMFPGSYHAVPAVYYVNGQVSSNIVLTKDGNYVTIIGETSPYITGVSADQKTPGYYDINGSRFNQTSNQVTINGVTKTLNSARFTTGGSDSWIVFNPSDFNLVAGNNYVVQVSTGEGASNSKEFTVSNVIAPTAFFLIDGQQNATLTVGQTHQKSWTSTGGVSWNTTYTFSQDPSSTKACTQKDANGNFLSGSWNSTGGATANGSVTNAPAADKVGCITAFFYTVTNAAGTSVVSTSTQRTISASVTPTGTWSYPTSCPTTCGTAQSTQTQTCAGGNGTCSGSDTSRICNATAACPVTPPQPTASISASPTSVTSGQSTRITWSSTNASQCILGGDFIEGNGVAQGASGSLTVTPTKSVSSYSIRCTDPRQIVQESSSVTVNMTSPAAPAAPTCSDPVAYYYYYAPDVKTAGVDALSHWNSNGYKEGRQSCWSAPAPASNNNKPTGTMDGITSGSLTSCGMVSGWAFDADKTSASNEVHLYVTNSAGTQVGYNAGVTNAVRADVNNAFNLTGAHGYNYQIPNLTAGTYTVNAYGIGLDSNGNQVGNENTLLSNSPKTFTCSNTASITNRPTILGDFASTASCTNLPRNLHRGAESSSVSKLQDFLSQKGFLADANRGYYGDKTVEAVKDYQASKGLPETGMVYDFTRREIMSETCR